MKLSTLAPSSSAYEKNEAPESNIESDDDAPDSLALIDPNPDGTSFYDDIWMVYITGVDQDLDILQDLILADSIAADRLSSEVTVDEGTEGAHKYEFPDRANVTHIIPSEENSGYIPPRFN